MVDSVGERSTIDVARQRTALVKPKAARAAHPLDRDDVLLCHQMGRKWRDGKELKGGRAGGKKGRTETREAEGRIKKRAEWL